MSRTTPFLAVIGALATVATACGDSADVDTAGPAPSITAAEPEVQTLDVVGVDYGFKGAPERLSAGVVELNFANQGKVSHEFALIEIGDTPIEQLYEDFPAVMEGGPIPEYAEHLALAAFADPGTSSDVAFTVAEGTYALICSFDGDASQVSDTTGTSSSEDEDTEEPTGAPHYELGMAQVLTVGPAATDVLQTLPEVDGSITAVDYGFDVDVSDRDQSITYLNDGPEEIHFAGISVFPEGTDEATAEAAFQVMLESEEDAPPPDGVPMPEDVGFSGVYSPGLGANFELMEPFQAGRTYLVSCFIQDRAGGPPHAIAHRMYQVFTVE